MNIKKKTAAIRIVFILLLLCIGSEKFRLKMIPIISWEWLFVFVNPLFQVVYPRFFFLFHNDCRVKYSLIF